MDRCLTLLGLAKKAGMLAVGDEPVSKAAFTRKARLILSASDAGSTSKRRAGGYADSGGAAYLILPHTKAELGAVVGRGLPGIFAILDAGLASSIANGLAAVSPEVYGDTAELMRRKSERALRRKKEAACATRRGTGKRRTAQ